MKWIGYMGSYIKMPGLHVITKVYICIYIKLSSNNYLKVESCLPNRTIRSRLVILILVLVLIFQFLFLEIKGKSIDLFDN